MLMKTLANMTTENENATAGNASAQTTQKVATSTGALGYLRKQDLAQLEAFVTELAARVEALEALPAQIADLQQKLADLSAAVSQLQGMLQDATTKTLESAQKIVEEKVKPVVKELAKDILLIVDALKMTKK
jgi:NTP pyrophosphatase (non-canonical NTP hydrolase)